MDSLSRLRDMLQCEIDKIADQGELTAGSLETVGKLVDAMKDIDEITQYDNGHSARGYGYRMPFYYDEASYNDGSNRGRSMRGMPRGRYSYADGRDHLIEQLEQMMDQAGTEKERQAIQKCIKQMEQA